jgi:hypothetical protein
VDEPAVVLVVTVAFLTLYVIGVGGTTATAIRIREAWRHRAPVGTSMQLRPGVALTLDAPTLPSAVRMLRLVGWIAFPIALLLAIFANGTYPLVVPLAVVVTVAINAFYFTVIPSMGEPLTLTRDGFKIGSRVNGRSVRWIHVTELLGARVGAFKGIRMSEKGEWQDPKLVPNVIFYRLNQALVQSRKTWLQKISGFSYYDGVIHNAFGISTEQLLNAMREWQSRAIEAEAPPLRRPRPGERLQTQPREVE